MIKYAQIRDDGTIVSISYLSNEVNADNMIKIDESTNLNNKKYYKGKWVDIPEPKSETTNEKSEYEMIKAIYEKLFESEVTK